jgi:hypothetical protein
MFSDLLGVPVFCLQYYASKSFFDPVKKRRILFGWIYETDSQQSNIKRGWASVQVSRSHLCSYASSTSRFFRKTISILHMPCC